MDPDEAPKMDPVEPPERGPPKSEPPVDPDLCPRLMPCMPSKVAWSAAFFAMPEMETITGRARK